jgi:uncharacterized membrane protein YphA (DoxX/SURF4 family)
MSTDSSKLGRILLTVGRLLLAGIFLFAAYAKLKPQINAPWSVKSVKISLAMFAMQVDSFQMLPPQTVSPAAHLLPFAELTLGLWLLSGIWLHFSSLITTLLLAGFFGALVRAYSLGLQINCGCFGPNEHLGKSRLVEEVLLLALSLAVTIGAFLIRRQHVSNQIPAVATPQRSN